MKPDVTMFYDASAFVRPRRYPVLTLQAAEWAMSPRQFDRDWPPAVKIGGAWFCAPAEWIKQTGAPFGFQATVGDAAIAERERQKIRQARIAGPLPIWC